MATQLTNLYLPQLDTRHVPQFKSTTFLLQRIIIVQIFDLNHVFLDLLKSVGSHLNNILNKNNLLELSRFDPILPVICTWIIFTS